MRHTDQYPANAVATSNMLQGALGQAATHQPPQTIGDTLQTAINILATTNQGAGALNDRLFGPSPSLVASSAEKRSTDVRSQAEELLELVRQISCTVELMHARL